MFPLPDEDSILPGRGVEPPAGAAHLARALPHLGCGGVRLRIPHETRGKQPGSFREGLPGIGGTTLHVQGAGGLQRCTAPRRAAKKKP